MDNLDSWNELEINDISDYITWNINKLWPDWLSKKLISNLHFTISDFSKWEISKYLNKIYDMFSIQVDEIIDTDDTLNETEIEKYKNFKNELKLEIEEAQNNDLYFWL